MAVVAGQKIGPYEVAGQIGAGGMGEVYKARDPRLGRDVAIKVLPAIFSSDPDRLQRFAQEARAAAALNHPNILAIYDIGTREGNRRTTQAVRPISPRTIRKAMKNRTASGISAPNRLSNIVPPCAPGDLAARSGIARLVNASGNICRVQY